jgi:hypothetical protein
VMDIPLRFFPCHLSSPRLRPLLEGSRITTSVVVRHCRSRKFVNNLQKKFQKSSVIRSAPFSSVRTYPVPNMRAP